MKNCFRIRQADAMLGNVDAVLCRVVDDLHVVIICIARIYVKMLHPGLCFPLGNVKK
jgi:hypothetical protein